jgi:proline iminopeptidase
MLKAGSAAPHVMRPVSRRGALLAAACCAAASMVGGPAFAGYTSPVHGRGDESGYVQVPGGRVWWQKFGRGSKTPILTLHGGPGAAHNYLLPLRALAEDRTVIFYDQLGCGLSDAPEDDGPYHIGRFVEELDVLRHALGLDRVVLYGHSWGTMLAIEYFATGHATGVEKLILGGALASVPQFVAGTRRRIASLKSGRGARLLALLNAGQTETPEYQKLVQLYYDQFVLRTPPTPECKASFDALAKSPAYRIMNGPNEFTVTGNFKDWDRRADLSKIQVSTLLITSEFDEVTLDCHETIRDGVSGSVLKIMPACSHLAMQEAPEAYNALVRAYLA